MRSKHVCLVFDSEGTFDIRWVGACHDTDVDVLRRTSLASCPDAVSVILVVQSATSPVSSWHALRELERRYPGVPTFMTTPAPGGDWVMATLVAQIGPLPEPRSLCARSGGGGAIEMIGASPAVNGRVRSSPGVSASDTSVLITGEQTAQRARCPKWSTAQVRGLVGVSCRSTAPRFRIHCSRARCSAINGAPSPGQSPRAKGGSARRTTERCSLTRSES